MKIKDFNILDLKNVSTLRIHSPHQQKLNFMKRFKFATHTKYVYLIQSLINRLIENKVENSNVGVFLKFELGLGKKILKCLILKWKIHNAFLFFEFLT